jgi:hypothetical protein
MTIINPQMSSWISGTPSIRSGPSFRSRASSIGTSSIDEDGTLRDFDTREVRVAEAIIEHARTVFSTCPQQANATHMAPYPAPTAAAGTSTPASTSQKRTLLFLFRSLNFEFEHFVFVYQGRQ